MRVLFILSLALTAVLAAPAEEITPFIVGGVNALPGEFPYIVSLQWVLLGQSTHTCGGVILNNVWVLTAAHCLTEVPSLGRIEVLAGNHNLAINDVGQVRVGINAGASIIHPDWAGGGGVGPDDLALIRLAVPLTFSATIRAVRLPQPDAIPAGPGTLSGWGSTGGITGGVSNILQKAILSTIPVQQCRDAIHSLGLNGDLVDYTNFCTGPLTGGLSACAGDSGGPLIQGAAPNEVLIGIVSWGITPCGTNGAPSAVFKRVSAYNEWIATNTGVTA